MKSQNIKRATFSDRGFKLLAYEKLQRWLSENPDRNILNISDYCDNEGYRYIIVYYEQEPKNEWNDLRIIKHPIHDKKWLAHIPSKDVMMVSDDLMNWEPYKGAEE